MPILSRACFLTSAALGFLTGSANADARTFLARPDDWFVTDEARTVAANILSHQSDSGGWPKNVSTTDSPFRGDRKQLAPTYDNGATTDELRFLARIFVVTKDSAYRAAFSRGLDHVLDGQYENGGWPQSHPPGKGYARHITFNDNAMTRLLEFVRDVATRSEFSFVDGVRRKRAADSFDRGVACLLKCQIRVSGKRTVWCAQHDEIDFRPRPARSFELASLSGSESVGITRLLMRLENPSPDTIRSIEAAVAWFQAAKLTGIRVDTVDDAKGPRGKNRVVVNDPNAPPLWARFYAIESGKPFFCDRDGVPKPQLAEIGYERRNGYSWYGTWPKSLLQTEYPAWKIRIAKEQ